MMSQIWALATSPVRLCVLDNTSDMCGTVLAFHCQNVTAFNSGINKTPALRTVRASQSDAITLRPATLEPAGCLPAGVNPVSYAITDTLNPGGGPVHFI